MRTISALICSVAVFAALGLQQYGVFAAPVTTESLLFNATVTDPVKFLLGSRALTGGFIGFHGTNALNAAVYQKQASKGPGVPVPPAFNGADNELSPGLYVSDDITTAKFYATTSANLNKLEGKIKDGADIPVICAVTAPMDDFVNGMTKVWIPVEEIARLVDGKNDPVKLALQETRIVNAHYNPTTTVRFSVLDVYNPNSAITGNQLLIPPGILNRFTIPLCVPLSNTIEQLPAQLGHSAFPTFNYRNLRAAWHIV